MNTQEYPNKIFEEKIYVIPNWILITISDNSINCLIHCQFSNDYDWIISNI